MHVCVCEGERKRPFACVDALDRCCHVLLLAIAKSISTDGPRSVRPFGRSSMCTGWGFILPLHHAIHFLDAYFRGLFSAHSNKYFCCPLLPSVYEERCYQMRLYKVGLSSGVPNSLYLWSILTKSRGCNAITAVGDFCKHGHVTHVQVHVGALSLPPHPQLNPPASFWAHINALWPLPTPWLWPHVQSSACSDATRR